MAIGSNESVQFEISNIIDNQILVYDAYTGTFKNETAAIAANASVTGLGRNIGSTGVGLYKQNDNQYLEFYKIDAGSNVTLSLNDNVLTIDATVGVGNTTLADGNANTVVVVNSDGNVVAGSDSLTFDGTTFSIIGANANVDIANGVITASNLVTTNFQIAGGNISFPTVDGNANQILSTDGNGTLSFVNPVDISGKLDSLTFNAHVAQAMITTGNNAPALHNLYSLGNSTNKYSQVFATYFRGTADLAVNATNLGSQPAANYMLRADSYTSAQVDALIANVDVANTDGLLNQVYITNGSSSYTNANGNIDIRSTDNYIDVDVDTINQRVTLSLDTSQLPPVAFSRIAAEGNASNYIVADSTNDVLNFVGGSGISISANPNNDTVTITATGSAAADISNSSIADLSDVSTLVGIADGQALVWSAANSTFEYGNVNSDTDLTSFSVTTASPSGNGSLSYSNISGVFTFTPANVQASTQSLSWDSNTSILSISSGNSVDLSALGGGSTYSNVEVQAYLDAQGYSNVDSDAQTLSLSGNTITISGSNSNVDLTSALGNVAGNYGDANVHALGEGNWAGNIIPNANETYDLGSSSFRWRDLYLSGNTIDLGGTIISRLANGEITFGTTVVKGGPSNSPFLTDAEFATANANMTAYVDALESRIIGGANVNLDSLAEVANALANSNTELSTVAFTGTYSDLQSKPSLALSGNTYLTFDSANIDLSSVVGQTGAQGPQGNDGVSVSSASLSGDNLQITLSNATVLTAGNVRGPVGPQGNAGPQGDGNAGVSSATVNGSGNLVITLNDSTTIDAGNVKGADGSDGATGPQGNAGVGITSVSLVGSNLVLNYSNTSTQDVGNIQGPQGNAGTNGTDVSSATVNGSGNLIITLSDASTVDAGNVRGADGTDGADGIQLSNLSVTTASNSGNGSLAYNNTTGVFTFTPPDLSAFITTDNDAQTLSLSGNVITISGSNSNVDLTTALANVSGGSSYTNANVDAYLQGVGNQITYASGIIGLANTTVSAGTYGSSTQVPRITVDEKGRITSVTQQAVSGGGGGGGSAAVEYFKLNYTSAGAVDTSVGTGGISNISSNIGNVTVNNGASNSCEIVVDFGGNYNFPPVAIMAYGYAQSTSEYNIKHMTQNTVNTTLKLDGSSSPHGSLGSANITMSLTRSETGASSGFGQTSHAWIYFTMGS